MIHKNWTNQKIYVNGVKVMDNNSSFSNASNPIWLVANYDTSQKQWPMKYLSEMFFERWIMSDDDMLERYNKTKNIITMKKCMYLMKIQFDIGHYQIFMSDLM